jgi:hypothetical protein
MAYHLILSTSKHAVSKQRESATPQSLANNQSSASLFLFILCEKHTYIPLEWLSKTRQLPQSLSWCRGRKKCQTRWWKP